MEYESAQKSRGIITGFRESKIVVFMIDQGAEVIVEKTSIFSSSLDNGKQLHIAIIINIITYHCSKLSVISYRILFSEMNMYFAIIFIFVYMLYYYIIIILLLLLLYYYFLYFLFILFM